MNQYKTLVEFILQNIGGKDNVLSVTHCMTRLRFTLKNDSLVNEEELLKSKEIITAQHAGGRYQIVIGTHVADVFSVVQDTIKISEAPIEEKKKGAVNVLIDTITKIITPVLGILTASGLLQGILAILSVTNVLSTTDGAYIILHAMGQTAFYFLPIVLGYTSAKAFKLNPFVGMMLGATLVIPELMTNLTTEEVLYTLFEGTIFQTPVHSTFFGIPILFPANGYQYSVIPIIFITYIGSKVSNVLDRIVPKLLAHNLNAFLTIFITVPISILMIGPITNVLSALIAAGVSGLYTISPVVTSVVVALLYQPLVIFGLHWPISAIGINNLAQFGSDYIFPMSFTASFAQTAVVLAVFLRTRSRDQKALAIPAMISGLFCIIEPAIYGFSLPVKKRMIFSMVGGAVGALILAIFSTKMYTFSFGILGLVSFINPETGSISGLIIVIIATIATMAVTFLLTYFTFKEEKQEREPAKKEELNLEYIVSPLQGKLTRIEESSDKMFASKALGNGFIITPEKGKLCSPISGKVKAIFPDGHAIGIESSTGVEVLIHIGVDIANLDTSAFQIHVKEGQTILQGEHIADINLELVRDAGYSTETAVIITNTNEYSDFIFEGTGNVHITDKVLTILPFRNYKETNKRVEVQ